MGEEKSPVAVFDFDGTIITGDSFLPFMRYTVGAWRYYLGVLKLLPWLGAYAFKQVDNRKIKEKVIDCFLKGQKLKEVEKKGRKYAMDVLIQRERPDMQKRMNWHQKEKHLLVLASASLLVYLRPWAEYRGFDGVCGAKLATDSEGRITGKIEGNNGFGPEKVEAVCDWLSGKRPSLKYAYGDSHGDRDLLEWADVKIFKGQEI